ncbi:helix-turn-helix domain-containing protein [Ktedonobacter racemifer]|uniref:helix-turn-helix domain-containing protein n=1 Tax=Ktedonobacter racemifer TaxID=363277 RepID=UPI00058FBA67
MLINGVNMIMIAEKATEARAMGLEGDRYYSLAQVAAFMGTTRQTIHRHVGTGVIPAMRAGRAFIVKGSDLQELIAQRA